MFLQMILILVVLIPLLAIVLDSQVGRALASRLERRGLDAPGDVTAERLAYLESEVERLSSEVERLDEEGQFVHRLLTEGKGGSETGSPETTPPKGEGGASLPGADAGRSIPTSDNGE